MIRSASRIFPSTSAIDGLVRINQMGAAIHDVWRDWMSLWALTAAFWSARGGGWPTARIGSVSPMGANSSRRPLALLALVVGIGSAAFIAYRLQATAAPSAPILGVVHQTEIHIAPEMSGRMTSFRVSAGQTVHKGDILAVLSSPELTAAVEEARANLATATANRANVDAGVRKEEVDTAAQDVRIAEANLVLARLQHSRTATLAIKDFASKQQLDETSAALTSAEANLSQLQSGLRTERRWSDRGGARHRQGEGRLCRDGPGGCRSQARQDHARRSCRRGCEPACRRTRRGHLSRTADHDFGDGRALVLLYGPGRPSLRHRRGVPDFAC